MQLHFFAKTLMKTIPLCLVLLCVTPIFAHAQSASCQKLVSDAARIYTYTSICSKHRAVNNIFANQQNQQATTALFERVQAQCGGDDVIIAEARRYAEQDAELKHQLQVQKRPTATFCKSKAPILRQILNNHK